MDDYLKYDFSITIDDLKKIVAAGAPVTIIINGYYYNLKKEGLEKNER